MTTASTELIAHQAGIAKANNRNIIIIGLLFFVFGFVTWLGSVLIPYLRIACELSSFESYFVAFSFYISYTVMAIPSAWVLKENWFQKRDEHGFTYYGGRCIVFYSCRTYRMYPVIPAWFICAGCRTYYFADSGQPYITILGPQQSAAKRISVMGICNGIAGVIAPIILGAVILQDADGLDKKITVFNLQQKNEMLNELAHRVILPYAIIMITLVMLALFIYFSSLPEVDADTEDEQ